MEEEVGRTIKRPAFLKIQINREHGARRKILRLNDIFLILILIFILFICHFDSYIYKYYIIYFWDTGAGLFRLLTYHYSAKFLQSASIIPYHHHHALLKFIASNFWKQSWGALSHAVSLWEYLKNYIHLRYFWYWRVVFIHWSFFVKVKNYSSISIKNWKIR